MPGKVKWLWSINGNGNGNSNVVTLDTSQTITGPKQFNGATQFQNVVTIHNTTSQDNSLALYRENTKANFISFYNGSTRQGFLGKAATSDTQLTLKAETGDLVLNCSDTSHSINMSSKKVINVATPTNNTDAANKQYVDNTVYTGLTTIKNQVGNISTLDDTWRQVLDYTNMENNFRIEGQTSYLVIFKENVSNRDIYGSCVIAVNSADYDNCGTSSLINWGATEVNGILFTISLKNNQFKLWAKRGSGTSTNWNTNTRIYIKKLSQGGVS